MDGPNAILIFFAKGITLKDIVLFDLDGTIALVEHRYHFIAGKKKDWRGYFAACVDDPPNPPIIAIFQALQASGTQAWIVTGRSDEVRTQTVAWLEDHGVVPTRLIMRRAGDFRPDDILKHSWLADGTIPRERVMMVLDDRDKVVAMWRREGFVCLQVAPGDF